MKETIFVEMRRIGAPRIRTLVTHDVIKKLQKES